MEKKHKYVFKDKININIVRTNIVRKSLFSYTEYVLEFRVLNTQKTIKKRFSDFVVLYLHLKDYLYARFHESLENICVLPAKKIFGRFNNGFIEDRRQQLEHFLNKITEVQNAYLCDYLYDFLCLDNITKCLFKLMCTDINDLSSIQKLLRKVNYILFMSRTNTIKSAECDIINFLFHLKRHVKLNNETKFFILNIFLHHLTYVKTAENLLNIQLMKFAFEIIQENISGDTIDEILLKTSSETVLRIVDKKSDVFLEYLRKYNFREICTIFNIVNKKKEENKNDKKLGHVVFNIYILVSLLLLSSIHLNEIQNYFLMKNSMNRGISILGFMYDSHNINVQIICCIILSLLIINKKIKDEEIIYKTKMSILLIQNDIQNIRSVDYQLIEIICSKQNIILLNNILELLLKEKEIDYNTNMDEAEKVEKYSFEGNPLEKDLFYEQKVKHAGFSNNDIILQFILFIISIGVSEFSILKKNLKFKMKKRMLLKKIKKMRDKTMKKKKKKMHILSVEDCCTPSSHKCKMHCTNYASMERGSIFGNEKSRGFFSEEDMCVCKKEMIEEEKGERRGEVEEVEEEEAEEEAEEGEAEEGEGEGEGEEEGEGEGEDEREKYQSGIESNEQSTSDKDSEESISDSLDNESEYENNEKKIQQKKENYKCDDDNDNDNDNDNNTININNNKERRRDKKGDMGITEEEDYKKRSTSNNSSRVSSFYSFSSGYNSDDSNGKKGCGKVSLKLDQVNRITYEDTFSVNSLNIKNDLYWTEVEENERKLYEERNAKKEKSKEEKVMKEKNNEKKDGSSNSDKCDSSMEEDEEDKILKIIEEIKVSNECRRKITRRIRRINEQILLIVCNEQMIHNIYKCTYLKNYKIRTYAAIILFYVSDIYEIDSQSIDRKTEMHNKFVNIDEKEKPVHAECVYNDKLQLLTRTISNESALSGKQTKNFICSVEGDYFNYVFKLDICDILLYYLYNETCFYEHILNHVKAFMENDQVMKNLSKFKINERDILKRLFIVESTMNIEYDKKKEKSLRRNGKKKMGKTEGIKKKEITSVKEAKTEMAIGRKNERERSVGTKLESERGGHHSMEIVESMANINSLTNINNIHLDNLLLENDESRNMQCVLYKSNSYIRNHIFSLYGYINNLRKLGMINNIITKLHKNIKKKVKKIDVNFLFDILKKKIEEKKKMKENVNNLKMRYEVVNIVYNEYINLQYETNKCVSAIEKLYEQLEVIEKERKKNIRKFKCVQVNVGNYRKKLINLEKLIEESPFMKKSFSDELIKIKENIGLYKKDKRKLSFYILLHKFYLDNVNSLGDKLKVISNTLSNIKLLLNDLNENRDLIIEEIANLLCTDVLLISILKEKLHIVINDEQQYTLLLNTANDIENFNHSFCNEKKLIIINNENKAVKNQGIQDLFQANNTMLEKYKYYFNKDNILNSGDQGGMVKKWKTSEEEGEEDDDDDDDEEENDQQDFDSDEDSSLDVIIDTKNKKKNMNGKVNEDEWEKTQKNNYSKFGEDSNKLDGKKKNAVEESPSMFDSGQNNCLNITNSSKENGSGLGIRNKPGNDIMDDIMGNKKKKIMGKKKKANKFSENNSLSDFDNSDMDDNEFIDKMEDNLHEDENEDGLNLEITSSDEENMELQKKIKKLNNYKNGTFKEFSFSSAELSEILDKKMVLEILDIIKERKKQIEKKTAKQNIIYKNIHRYNGLLNKCKMQINEKRVKFARLTKNVASIDTGLLINQSKNIYKTIREWDEKIKLLDEEIKKVETEKKEKEKEIITQKRKLEKKERQKNQKKEELRLLVTDMYKLNNKVKKKCKKNQKIFLFLLYNSWYLFHYIYIIYLNTVKLKKYLSLKQILSENCRSSAKQTVMNINYFTDLLKETDF